MNSSYSITSKFQVTIPKEARQKLKLKANDQVAFDLEGDQVVIKRVPTIQEVAAEMAADLKRRGIKPATDKQIREARDNFYKKGMKWQ